MTNHITAEIVSIGTEILLGELTDTNSVYLARALRDMGINIFYMTSVGDNKARIVNALEIAMSRADIVITCGGLGPTVDDMTRQSVALATNRDLTFHQTLLDQIIARFEGFSVKMTENNKRQAYLPEGSIAINNPVGTAPSFIVEHYDKIVISLPGVPREMKYLMSNNVVDYLRERYQLGIIKARILKTAGIGESSLDDMLGGDLLNSSNPSIGLAAHSGQIDIRITAKSDDEPSADNLIAQTEQAIRDKAGKFIFGADEETLETVLTKALKDHNANMVILETGLDGAISRSINDIDPDVVAHAETFYTLDDMFAKYPFESLAMSDYALKITSKLQEQYNATVTMIIISNPDVDDDDDSSESTVIVVKTSDKTRQRSYGFGGQSELAKHWVTTWSLAAAWRMIKEKYDDNTI